MHKICKKVLILLALVGDKLYLLFVPIILNPPIIISVSLTRHRAINIKGIAFKYPSVTNIAVINTLSAIGSNIFPKVDSWLNMRAKKPSNQSVMPKNSINQKAI